MSSASVYAANMTVKESKEYNLRIKFVGKFKQWCVTSPNGKSAWDYCLETAVRKAIMWHN